VSGPREVVDLLNWFAGEGLANLDEAVREDAVVEPN